MPQDLAALLVEEDAVSQADMERALARQAQLGGALDTALLELELIGEGHLRSFLAHASGLPAVPPGAFEEVDARARRVFPAKVAERHRVAPFALDGRELSVVASHPVDGAAMDEIGFMLSLTLMPHVAPEWRVLDLIQRLYGGQLPARLAKLAESEKARGSAPPPAPATPAPVPAAKPPPLPAEPPPAASPKPSAKVLPAAAPPRAAAQSVEEAFFAAGEAGAFTPAPIASAPEPAPEAAAAPEPEPEPERAPEPPPLPHAAPEPPKATVAEPPAALAAPADDETSFADIEPERPGRSGFGDGSEPAEPLLAALELAVDAYDALWADAKPVAAAQTSGESARPSAPTEPAAEPPPAEPAAVAATGAQEPSAAEEEGEVEPEPPPGDLDRSAPPRWSIDDARAALAAARHRDEVVLVALRYARDFFEYAALFAVTKDAVVGHDGLGLQEDARPHARGTAIYADDPGIVKTVLHTRSPYLGPVARDAAGTANILDGLWRGTPRIVLLYPISIGDRPVAVLYADNGEAPVSVRRLGDLLLFLSTIGGTFERIIRARKRRRRSAPPPPPKPPAAPAGPSADDGIVSEPAPSWMEPPPDVTAPAPREVPVPEAANEPALAGEPQPAPEPAPEPERAPAAEPEPEPEPEPAPEPPPHPALSPGGGEGKASEAKAAAGEGPVEAAVALLLAGGSGPPDRVAPIVELLLDSRPEIAAAARGALSAHRKHPAFRPVPERLRRGLLGGVGDRPILAALALGELRDVESIPNLIQAFEGGSPKASAAAADALARITLQNLGTSPQKWLRWWKEHRGRSRAEWLFDALTSADRDLRSAAERELRAAAEPPVRYTPDLPSAELEAAARSWWVWWSRQGIGL